MGWILPGIDSGGIPMHIVNALLSTDHFIKYFVETGTAGGESIFKVQLLFKECHTIDVINENKEGLWGNAMFHKGDSAKLLPDIIKSFDGSYCLFWLDAHYSGDKPNTNGYPECPLLDEIEAVSKYEKSLIIIDDARLFFGPPPAPNDPREWPLISEIFEKLRKGFPWHHITIRDDYIVAIPIHFLVPFDQEWRDRYKIRYPDATDKLKTEAKNLYKAVLKYLE